MISLSDSRGIGIAEAQWKVLTFQFDANDLALLGPRHLIYGLLVTWAVGIGRYWDHPNPYLVQSLGLGSLPVLLGLVILVYVLLLPLQPVGWSFVNLLTFVSLTALPALLYAIPVERFMSFDAAATANVWFLASVAGWRVALLGRYLKQATDLSGAVLVCALLLPIALVIVVLTSLNLEQVVFNVMAGLREEDVSTNDRSYGVLFILTAGSSVLSPLLLFTYAFAVWSRRRSRRAA